MGVLAPAQPGRTAVRGRHGARATVATTPMTTKMAKNAPKTNSIFFWPFWRIRVEHWHTASLAPVRPQPAPGVGGDARLRPRAGSAAAASSSTVRSRPARTPTTICGTIRTGHQRDRQAPAAAVLVEDAHQERARDGDQIAGALREGRQLGEHQHRSGPGIPTMVSARGKAQLATPSSSAQAQAPAAGARYRPSIPARPLSPSASTIGPWWGGPLTGEARYDEGQRHAHRPW
ncbi:hypothetical protein SALBM311S_09441 [Streptomyces alboniger]